jgi:hypothetical protein
VRGVAELRHEHGGRGNLSLARRSLRAGALRALRGGVLMCGSLAIGLLACGCEEDEGPPRTRGQALTQPVLERPENGRIVTSEGDREDPPPTSAPPPRPLHEEQRTRPTGLETDLPPPPVVLPHHQP